MEFAHQPFCTSWLHYQFIYQVHLESIDVYNSNCPKKKNKNVLKNMYKQTSKMKIIIPPDYRMVEYNPWKNIAYFKDERNLH